MLNRVSGCGRQGFPTPPARWRGGAIIALLAGLAAIWSVGRAAAQDRPEWKPAIWDAEAIYRGATVAPDLVLPDAAESMDQFVAPRMALLKPAGTGPFPAIALLHQCAGLNPAVAAWARRAVARGYVVLLLDSFGSRDVKSVCFGPKNGVNFFRGARDAMQAAKHLRRRAYVDRNRVALVGFSWGAMVGLMAASSHTISALKFDTGFAAVASFYPGCFRLTPPGRPPYDVVNSDVAQPLLVLMGDADTETPARECIGKLEALKRDGRPVEWHLYPGATHCWDCQQLDGFSKVDVRGHRVDYHFRKDVTADSERRLFDFLERAMAKQSPVSPGR
jgi:dienelactone hydrolase